MRNPTNRYSIELTGAEVRFGERNAREDNLVTLGVDALTLVTREKDGTWQEAELHVTLSGASDAAKMVNGSPRFLRDFRSVVKDLGYRGVNSINFYEGATSQGNTLVLDIGPQFINAFRADEDVTAS